MISGSVCTWFAPFYISIFLTMLVAIILLYAFTRQDARPFQQYRSLINLERRLAGLADPDQADQNWDNSKFEL